MLRTWKVGEQAQTWWDSGGKRGATILVGTVIAAGPKRFAVRWPNGTVNYIEQDNPHFELWEEPQP